MRMQPTFRWQPCLRVARESGSVSWFSRRCKFTRISDREIRFGRTLRRSNKKAAPQRARPFHLEGVSLLEQRQDALAVLVGDRERLSAELLLDLQGRQAGRF